MKPRLIVIGGGAAGVFCAINAARMNPHLQVTVVEKTGKLLSKVKISGGGRCNVTNVIQDRDAFSAQYPRGSRFVKKAFYHFFSSDTIEWFASRGVSLHAEADGRMFPVTNLSQTVIDCLLKEADQYGVGFKLHHSVDRIEKWQEGWKIHFTNDASMSAEAVCIAAGGGHKLEQFNWFQSLGHTIIPPVPSLFTFNIPHHPITELMGVSVPYATVKVQSEQLKQSGPLLITHWGLSGPAVLRLSAWGARILAERNYQFTILINWLHQQQEDQVKAIFQQIRIEHGSKKVSAHCPFPLPIRLWQFLIAQAEIKVETRWAECPQKEQNRLLQMLLQYELHVNGKSTFKEEFVTAGGVDVKEIHPSTMESKMQPGIYFAGEVMDVDGITGGFNFQHAWTSGYLAAKAIAERAG